jgi:secreted trypsin-like serine protease
VALGKHKLSAPGGEHIDVAAVAVHPSYGSSGKAFDVALLQLRQASAMTPASLLAAGVSIPRGTSATVMGWGALYKDGPAPDDLQAVDLSIWSDADCASAGYTIEQRQLHASLYDPQTMICAGDYTSQKISCYGDSGGPLMTVDGSGTWRLIGVVSFDVGQCAGYHNPDIYAWVHGPTLQQWVTAGIAGAYATPAAPAAPAARPVAAPQTGAACLTTRQARARAAYRVGRARTALRRAGRPAAKRRLARIVKQRRAALRRADARLSRAC